MPMLQHVTSLLHKELRGKRALISAPDARLRTDKTQASTVLRMRYKLTLHRSKPDFVTSSIRVIIVVGEVQTPV